MKACSAFPRVGEHWMNEGRIALEKHWGENVRRGRKALAYVPSRGSAVFRTVGRSASRRLGSPTGILLRDKVHGGWIYPEHSAILAQQRAEQANAVKGRRSVVTNLFAVRLVAFLARGLLGERLRRARQRPPPLLVPQGHRLLQGLPGENHPCPKPPQRHLPNPNP